MPRLRPPRPDELYALSALCLRSKAHWGYDAAFLAACRPELTLTETDLHETDLIVADLAGRPAGLAQISRAMEPADLMKLFVDPPHIGTGLGRTLFDWATATARAQGAARLTIEADPGAQGFYQAMGATHTGWAPSGSIPGRRLPLLELKL